MMRTAPLPVPVTFAPLSPTSALEAADMETCGMCHEDEAAVLAADPHARAEAKTDTAINAPNRDPRLMREWSLFSNRIESTMILRQSFS